MKNTGVVVLICCAYLLLVAPQGISQVISDPTRPPLAVKEQGKGSPPVNTGFSLTAVFQKAQSRYAVINGKVVKKGDILNGVKVIEIGVKHVTLQDISANGKMINLQLLPMAISKTKVTKKVAQ